MKAIAYRRFGSPDVLRIEDFPNPSAPPQGVVVKLHASSINVIDSRSRRGEMSPFVNKRFPKIPGIDIAGTVSAIGPGVTRTKIGDAVYGAVNPFKGGAFAEFVAVAESAIATKPHSLTFEESAALPLAGLAALYSLRELGKVEPGQHVLIYGSSGGVGLLAIQLSKHFGAHVTTVSGPSGVAISRELGAEVALDYKAGPLKFPNPFDVIIDFSSRFPFAQSRPYLKSTGRFVDPSPNIPKFILSMLANPFRRQKHLMLTAEAHSSDLEFLASLADSGKLKPNVVKVYGFGAIQQAFAEQESGGVQGKLVIAPSNT